MKLGIFLGPRVYVGGAQNFSMLQGLVIGRKVYVYDDSHLASLFQFPEPHISSYFRHISSYFLRIPTYFFIFSTYFLTKSHRWEGVYSRISNNGPGFEREGGGLCKNMKHLEKDK